MVFGLSVNASPGIAKKTSEVVWLFCEQYKGNVSLREDHMLIVMLMGCV